MNASGRPFTEARCAAELGAARGLSLSEGVDRLTRSVEEWAAPRTPHDDLSILAVELV